MKMDLQLRAWLDAFEKASAEAPPPDDPLVATREGFHAVLMATGGPAQPVHEIYDRNIPGPAGDIRCKVYVPRKTKDALPVLIFYHGGGVVALSPETYNSSSTVLAAGADAIVVIPDYGLAPENPFPKPLEDCYAVLRWVQENAGEIGGDPERVAIAGDSGGGYLAAAVALEAKRLGTPQPVYQILIYPMTDMAGKSPSWVSIDHFINEPLLDWTISVHPGHENRLDPRASPLLAPDHSGLAPALIVAAELDPLVDEGKAYATKLQAAGVPTTYTLYAGAIHGFLSMAGIADIGGIALQHVCGTLRHVFSKAAGG